MFGRNDQSFPPPPPPPLSVSKEPPQHWSVHAEFTISHPGINDPDNVPQTHTEQDDNGVRMTYSWSSSQPSHSWSSQSASSSRSVFSENSIPKPYGYQKGNLLFTSIPPIKRPQTSRFIQDSGYGSDLLSPNSSRQTVTNCNRKCRSTCNIVLSANIQDEQKSSENENTENVHQCGRTQSLRCQTPTIRYCNRTNDFYGCGDPWCHHYCDDTNNGRFSPVLEQTEDLSLSTSTPNTSGRCRNSVSLPKEDNRKDACVQTFEMIDKCTSPFVKMDSFKFKQLSLLKNDDRKPKVVKKKYSSNFRRQTEPIFQRLHSPSTITPDSLDDLQVSHYGKCSVKQKPLIENFPKKDNDSSKSSDNSKKPRTVHIDVYCTGTEVESDSSSNSSSSSNNETASTPQTVFDSKKLRITHKRANDKQLPYNVGKLNIVKKDEEKKLDSDDDDDDDTTSTSYPSKLSSYSTIRDFNSSISSVPHSFTNYSMSSCTIPEDYDSVANTSWKDTFSDIDSLLQSRSSLVQTDSLEFVPKKLLLNNTPSIDETPEVIEEQKRNLLETPNNNSLHVSDSFEYANSEDRFRIKKMEELWTDKSKMWNSPQNERKHLLQQKKIKEYLEKRINDGENLPKWHSRDSETEDEDDELETNWTFNNNKFQSEEESLVPLNQSCKSPSVIAFQQKLRLNPALRSPFTIVPGIYTDQRAIARKFGPIVNAFKKPGHHIGPAKNPDCLCDHCQRHFMGIYRNRARSVGDPPSSHQNHRNFCCDVNTSS